MFFPIDRIRQLEICSILNLNISKQHNGIESKPLNHPIKIKNIVGDGNCLYRALSYSLTGSESSHYEIRQKINQVILIKSKHNFNELYLLIIIIFRSHQQMTELKITWVVYKYTKNIYKQLSLNKVVNYFRLLLLLLFYIPKFQSFKI